MSLKVSQEQAALPLASQQKCSLGDPLPALPVEMDPDSRATCSDLLGQQYFTRDGGTRSPEVTHMSSTPRLGGWQDDMKTHPAQIVGVVVPNVFKSDPGGQESTLGLLLEHALRIKEEVAASLQSTQGSIQVEALSRRLLENHIHAITHIVQKLSINMQAAEGHAARRDSLARETSLALQTLDQKSAAGVGDLRGRVARCDASIARLSADVISGGQQVRRLQQEVTELRFVLDVQLKRMETKLCQAIDKVESSITEDLQQLKTSLSDLHSKVQQLETRHSGDLREAEGNAARLRRWTEERLQASLQTRTQEHLQLQSLLQDQVLDAESKSNKHMRALEARVKRVEVQQGQFLQRTEAGQQRCAESKLLGRIRTLESSLQKEVQQLKQETHRGFKHVHDAIEILRQIGDANFDTAKTNFNRTRPRE